MEAVPQRITPSVGMKRVHCTLPCAGLSLAAWIGMAGASSPSSNASGDGMSDLNLLQPAIHATRLDYSEFDVPEAVTVITQEDIRLAGYLHVSELFRSVPGFRIVKIGDESRISYHGTAVRQNRRMLVSINGRSVLIGDGQYVEFDRLPIDLKDIARVTITRGPNGAAYGDNAFLASIDFETVGRDAPQGVSVRAGGGHNNRSNVGALINKSADDYDVQFSLSTEHDGGYDYSDAIGTPRDDGKEIKRAWLAVGHDSGPRSHWHLDSNIYDSENKTGIQTLRFTGEQNNDGQFVALSNKRELGESSRFDWFASYNHQKESIAQFGCYTPEAVAVATAALADPQIRAQFLAPAAFLPALLGVPLDNVCLHTNLDIASSRSELEAEFESRRGPWRYMVGSSATLIDASSAQYFANRDQHQRSYRLFGETDLSLGKVHTSLGAMAQDSNNIDNTQFAWRGAVNWQFLPNQVLRYSYAKSFRIPSLVETETFWTSTFYFGRRGEPLSTYQFSIASPLITNTTVVKPETIAAHSLGYFGTFLNSNATIDIKAFRERIRDPVESNVFYFSPPPFNSNSYTLSGAEAEATYRLNEQWKISGQYSYLDTSAQGTFERGLYGRDAGSVSLTYRPLSQHAFTVGYYGNSTISGHSYNRYDFIYNYERRFGDRLFRSQLIWNHHIGGVDGIHGAVPFETNEGYFARLDQLFLSLELSF